MGMLSPDASVVSSGAAALAHAPNGHSERSLPAPRAGTPARNGVDLARPWSFPGGHSDSVLFRKHPRSGVDVPVEIRLLRPDGSCYDQGSGVIRDLSYTGLRLGDVFLSHGRLLATYFGVELRPAVEMSGGGTIAGRILRTYASGYPGFGIEFLFPGSGVEERLRTSK